jgi:drug/metabolite transporter (DMT)-like permease
MKPADACIAVLVVVIWGLAFVARRIALDEFSPELMTALRFAIAVVPCLFVRKPDVSWPLLIAVSSFALLVPFVGSAASSIVFGEKFGPLRLAGMIAVSGGIAIMLLSKRPQDSSKQDPPKQVLPKIA